MNQADALYEALKHGDDDHRQWLREALAAFFSGRPVPTPRGQGNKEARIAELEREVAGLRCAEAARRTKQLGLEVGGA